jgi:L-Ala-D/L-Glu epimerase
VRWPLRLEFAVEELPLKDPFRISGYTFTQIPALFVRLTERELSGRGEAEGVYYLHDVPANMAEHVEAQRAAIEAGITRAQLRELMPPGGARNAVDCALWELEAKRVGQPIWKLAGIDQPVPLTTMFTIGADEPAAIAKAAAARASASALKLKLSGELEVDVERVRALRSARPDVWLAVDANQGYTLDSLEKLLPVLTEARVLLLEQPIARGHENALDHFDSPIPIAADESVQGLADMEGLVGRFDVVNIKLDKCGGLTEALLMIEQARRIGLKVMVGNMVGTSLAMAPAFVAGQLCDFVDLDGPTFLAADRTPSVIFDRGTIWCPEQIWG